MCNCDAKPLLKADPHAHMSMNLCKTDVIKYLSFGKTIWSYAIVREEADFT